MNVRFKKLDPEAKPFEYSREGDACMDMFALETVKLFVNEPTLIKTGIAVEIPEGYEGIVRGRSGYALKKGLFVHIGTIDSTYRGDVGVIAVHIAPYELNKTFLNIEIESTSLTVHKHARIAQFSIHPVTRISLIEHELSNTVRGDQGYGSSGY